MRGLPQRVAKELNGLTKYVNYDCNFKDSHCSARTDKFCCCRGCKSSVGYLEDICYDDVKIYADLFGENGFWTEKGCVLPRELRSVVCLTKYCGTLSNAESTLLHMIGGGERAYGEYGYFYRTSYIMEHLTMRLEKKEPKTDGWVVPRAGKK